MDLCIHDLDPSWCSICQGPRATSAIRRQRRAALAPCTLCGHRWRQCRTCGAEGCNGRGGRSRRPCPNLVLVGGSGVFGDFCGTCNGPPSEIELV